MRQAGDGAASGPQAPISQVVNKAEKWFKNAQEIVGPQNPRMTAVVDLDATLIIQAKNWKCRRIGHFKFCRPKNVEPFAGIPAIEFIDPQALFELSKFQQRGHCVKVVTAALYPYSEIQKILNDYGVGLTPCDYHNGFDLQRKGFKRTEKAQYIDSIPEFDETHMLFDDNPKNRPQGCCFYHVALTKEFPSLNLVESRLNELIIEMQEQETQERQAIISDENRLSKVRFFLPQSKQGLNAATDCCCAIQ